MSCVYWYRANSLHLTTSSTFNTTPVMPTVSNTTLATSNATFHLTNSPVRVQGSFSNAGSHEDSPKVTRHSVIQEFVAMPCIVQTTYPSEVKSLSPVPGSSLANCAQSIQVRL